MGAWPELQAHGVAVRNDSTFTFWEGNKNAPECCSLSDCKRTVAVRFVYLKPDCFFIWRWEYTYEYFSTRSTGGYRISRASMRTRGYGKGAKIWRLRCTLWKILGEKTRSYKNNDNDVSKILIVTGGGNDVSNLDYAIAGKCDTYITGEYGMYLQHYANFHKINLVVGSHTKTEIIGVRNFVNELTKVFNNIKAFEIDEPNYWEAVF